MNAIKSPALKTSVIVWFCLGNDSYVSSEADSAKGIYPHQLLTEFALKTARKHAESIVKEEEKNLSGLEKDLKNLEKNNKDYQKEIRRITLSDRRICLPSFKNVGLK
ncbi:MAG: hypothetical protein ACI8X3_003383 [Saprospiraceae bacterium]|jgi:hypothetical protein